MPKKIIAVCDTCKFALTGGEAKPGDPCPWCHRGTLQEPKGE